MKKSVTRAIRTCRGTLELRELNTLTTKMNRTACAAPR